MANADGNDDAAHLDVQAVPPKIAPSSSAAAVFLVVIVLAPLLLSIIVGLLEHTIVLLTIFVVSLLFLCVVSNMTMMTTKTMSPVRPFDCWRRSPQMTMTARTIAFLP